MTIEAVVFDIGGVLEITPSLGVAEMRESRLGLQPGGFEDLVDEIIYSHECGMSKPDPAIYALACERLRVEPAQMVFLDDYGPCVAGAREAGIHAVPYQDNAQAIRDIEALLAR